MGQLVKPESSEDLVKAIDFALSNDLEPVKKNARNYAEKHLSKEYILKSFENELINR
ncbi:putative glycosyl transferase [compost metagenome]